MTTIEAVRARWLPRAWPWWAQTLTVYAAARLLSLAGLAAVLAHQQPVVGMPEHSLPTFLGSWYDGVWYRRVAEEGYPRELPVDAAGGVRENAWAFYPLYPLLVRALMTATGGGWNLVAPLTSAVLGAAAMLVLYRLLLAGAPAAVAARPGLPLATVALLSLYPASPVLAVGYTESLALLLVVLTLLLLVHRRYLWALPAVVALGFTRPVGLPLVVAVLAHAGLRWWRQRRGADRVGTGEWAGMAALAGTAGVSALVWPAICGWVTGVPDAYLRTQQAWRQVARFGPFGGWLPVLGDRPALAVAWALAVVAVGALLASAAGRRLGVELVAWTVGYLGFLAAVLEPNSTSLVRFGLLAFPLVAAVLGLVARPAARARTWFALLCVASVAGQAAWLWWIWRVTVGDAWTPAP